MTRSPSAGFTGARDRAGTRSSSTARRSAARSGARADARAELATPRPKGMGRRRRGRRSRTATPRATRSRARHRQHSSRDAAALKLGDRARVELDGTTDEAFQLLDTAIESAPKLQPLYVLRAKAFLAEGNADMARGSRARRAARADPWIAEAAAIRGAAFEVQGNKTEAIAAYRRAR